MPAGDQTCGRTTANVKPRTRPPPPGARPSQVEPPTSPARSPGRLRAPSPQVWGPREKRGDTSL